MKAIIRRLQRLLHRDSFERELDEEMAHHLALKAEEEGGEMAARRQFGSVTFWKEESRRAWTGVFLEQLAQDLRYSVRSMNANRLFTLLAAASLALGIGANTAIYSFMDAILLRALPVKQPEQLVLLNWRAREGPAVANDQRGNFYEEGGNRISPNYPYRAYEFLRDHDRAFSRLFGFAYAGRLNAVVHGQAQLGEGEYVSGGFFSGLGVQPAVGRLLDEQDDQPGAVPVVAISFAFWQGQFGGRADAVGNSIQFNGKPFMVAGVTPPEFFGIRPNLVPDFYFPIRDLPLLSQDPYRDEKAFFADDHSYWIEMMGRLRPGVSFAAAQSESASLFRHWVSETARNEHDRKTLPSLWLEEGGSGVDSLRRQYSKPLFVLMAMVALILTIACANIANLLLARAASRRREIAVRLSLGAGRLRVIRQLLTESVCLAMLGAVGGVFIAAAGIRVLTLLMGNGDRDFTLHARIDWHVLSFTIAVALVTGLFFGIAPAIQATKVDVTPALKEVRLVGGPGRTRRFGLPFGARQVLIVFQIAVSMLLVAAAGLFVRTLANLNAVDIGFNPQNLLLFSLNGAQAGYKDQALSNLYSELLGRFQLIPGVRSVTLADMPLVANWWSSTDAKVPGSEKKGGETSLVTVGTGFFNTMQIPILAGRAIDGRDQMGSAAVAVVNEVFAKRYFPGVPPLGRHFQVGGDKVGFDVEIVGVARNTRYNSLKEPVPPVTYLSYLQTAKGGHLQQVYFELRTGGDPLALVQAVRQVVHRVSPRVPIADVSTQSRIIDGTISQERAFAALSTGFGVLALTMACVGLYATTAYAVMRRTHEIGIRMALGAVKRRIIWMIVREVLVLGVTGLVIGAGGLWESTALLKEALWGLPAHDPATFAIAASILVACPVMAGLEPAWRASRIDPMAAVRHE